MNIRTSECTEEPVPDSRPGITLERHLGEQAAQVIEALGRHVVEVHQMADRVQHREEQRRAGHDLMELDVRVDRQVLLDRVVLHHGQDVAGHGQQEQGVAEGEGGC